MQTIFTGHPHDNGLDLLPGSLVTNPRVGHVWWDDNGLDGGLVVSLDDGEEYLPDDADDAAQWLARRGYELDAPSRRDVADLGPREG